MNEKLILFVLGFVAGMIFTKLIDLFQKPI